MTMRGFDPDFADLPDYIIKITERIWEGRNIGLINRHYSEDCRIHTSMGPGRGARGAIAATLETLHAFPDRRLLPEDIVWSGNETDGFLSSHRIISPARHLGPGPFGPPTGNQLQFRSIADCYCTHNKITEEWLVRDQAGMCLQIGLSPETLAETLAAADHAAGRPPWQIEPAAELIREGGFRPAVLQPHPAAAEVRKTLSAIWTGKDLSAIPHAYHPACTIHLPRARTVYGHERFTQALFGYLAAFPDAEIAIEHSIALDAPNQPIRVATRWWLTGTHTGTGAFGPRSGATILALIITHSHVVDGEIREEWHVLDEVAILKQIAEYRLGQNRA